jgi:PEP-CTERM motif
MRRFLTPALFGAALIAASAAQAAPTAPTATMAPGDSFVEYTGTGTVGNNNVNVNNTLYWIYEGSFTYEGQAVDSWFLFFDPKLGVVSGTVDFGAEIAYLADDQAELLATSGFGKPGIVYDFSNPLTGLEPFNKLLTNVSGSTIGLTWFASNPGDHVRVLTVAAVPEPSTYALMLAGLGAVGFLAQRRRAV